MTEELLDKIYITLLTLGGVSFIIYFLSIGSNQRIDKILRTISSILMVIIITLFVSFFLLDLWIWETWKEKFEKSKIEHEQLNERMKIQYERYLETAAKYDSTLKLYEK